MGHLVQQSVGPEMHFDGPAKLSGRKKGRRNVWRENLLLLLTLLSVFLGMASGFALRPLDPSQRTIDMVAFPGELFMNLLKMLILPLIASSLISGLSQLDARQSGAIGLFSLLYYALTMSLAVLTGICLVLIIHPGDPSMKRQLSPHDAVGPPANVSAVERLMDLLRNMFPDNIVQAMFQQVETEYQEQQTVPSNASSPPGNVPVVRAVHRRVEGMDVLGLIVFFIAFGLVLGQMGNEAKPLIDLFVALEKVIFRLVGIVMWYSPLGIASLIAARILEISDVLGTAHMLALYVLTVLVGLLIQLFITLPAVLFFATRKNPFNFMRGLLQAALTALGTSSSAASLPVTFKCLEEINGVDPKYTKFVLPVGAMVNMDGTALYEAVASIFIAQLNGLEMTPGVVLTMALTATLASIGAASMPSAGLVTMLIVLTSVGLPSSDVTMIIAVDWLLDRIRTATNVMGDGVGCGFVEAMVERRLGRSSRSVPQQASTEREDDFCWRGDVEKGGSKGETDGMATIDPMAGGGHLAGTTPVANGNPATNWH